MARSQWHDGRPALEGNHQTITPETHSQILEVKRGPQGYRRSEEWL